MRREAVADNADTRRTATMLSQMRRDKMADDAADTRRTATMLSRIKSGRGRAQSIKANTITADEAHEMGKALGDHISDLHGGAFHAKFAQGLASGTRSTTNIPNQKAMDVMAHLPGQAVEGGFGAMVYFPKSQTVGHIGKMPVRGGKKRRAPAGEHDGRRKRAEIVRKVMSEQGLSMIEASKYVKAHGLY
jgi:hypothetical protein